MSKNKHEDNKKGFNAQFIRLRIMSMFFFLIFIIIVAGVSLYMYKKIETTTAQAQQIIVLKSELSIEAINFEAFQKVQNAWESKHSTTSPQIARNPFEKYQKIDTSVEIEEDTPISPEVTPDN